MRKLLIVCLMVTLASAVFAAGQAESGTQEGPVTVTYKSYTGPIDERLDYNQSDVGAFLEAEFNAKVELWPASETTYREELVTDAATGSLPDLLTIWVYPNSPEEILVLQKAAREGLLAGLNDAIDQYAPTIKQSINTPGNWPIYTQEYMKDPTFKGETYFLPSFYTIGEKKPPGWAFVIREDIRQELGLETPIYMDDTEQLLEILRDIKALNPVDINGSPAWPMGAIRRWNSLVATFTRPFDFGGGTGIDIDSNGNIRHIIETEYAWDQIVFMRKLVNEGLMDPESLTHTFEVGREKVAQGKYIVEPFFAGGGTDWSYHRVTVEADPDMSYDVMGSFYTHLGKPGPLLVNNIGMQTHFLNAVSSDANLDVLMPLIEFLASPTGVATNAYGVEGVHWDWDSAGNAVLKPQYEEAFLSADVPSPYLEVGAGAFNFVTTIMGINHPSRMIFDGTEKPRYPLDPYRDDEIDRRISLAYDGGKGLESKNGIALGSFMESYPQKDRVEELLSIPYMNENLMFPAYLAGSESEARQMLEDYRESVRRAGIDDYLQYLQDIYDSDPDRYVVYESMGG